MNTTAQRVLFGYSSRLTRRYPAAGARLLDSTVRPFVGSPMLSGLLGHRNRSIVRRADPLRRVLVIPDSHIGDAILCQGAFTAVRDFFPRAEIDYAVNETAAPIIQGNPEATRVIPMFAKGKVSSGAEIDALARLIARGGYDLCVCYSPFIETADLGAMGRRVLQFVSHAPTLVRNEGDDSRVNHLAYQGYEFIRNLLGDRFVRVRGGEFAGVRVTLSDEAVERAAAFAFAGGACSGGPVIMYNPDTASKYTLVPFAAQAELLMLLAEMDVAIWVGEGHTERGIGARLLQAIPPARRRRMRLVPAGLPLDAYAALIDFADLFVSGDTGPLHMAAARRYSRSGQGGFRNRTAVMSIFGATPARMSGYDSLRRGYLPANQDAPSWAYTAGSPCRNITCLNKLFKTCDPARCFADVDMAGVAGKARSYLDRLF